ncbi:hypothetical protein ARMGADRAFT_775766 [Armillaria gallica]|uniref:Uncharacterized protein n=1 Tax=Armillaria gallica TaxID=47427 RepID=A0A2H3CIH7_ARMGA|nr:hypothetical protein ARMGADRAFT_775766 [Armillaria gallica]
MRIVHLLTASHRSTLGHANTINNLQERQGDVTVNLGLDGDLDFEVKVKVQLQSCGGCNSLAFRLANDLSTEDRGRLGRCVLGLWGRHDTEDGGRLGEGFYNSLGCRCGVLGAGVLV